MKSGYKIVWSHQSEEDLEKTIEYLEDYFTEKELKNLAQESERTLNNFRNSSNFFEIRKNKYS